MSRILVIEDENEIRENVVDILEMEGFETLSAPNGELGVELALTHLPDLILCDIMMPGIDGYQVLMKLRDNATTTLIPFIFLTAKADRPSMRYGMVLGADDYLTKPFAVQDLLTAISTRLEKQQVILDRYAQAMEDLRGNIFNMLPHEFRTPLTSILGYADLLVWDADTLPTLRIKEMAGFILNAGERLQHLIENFLVYAQIEITRRDPERQAKMRSLRVDSADALTLEIAHDIAQKHDRLADLQIAVDEAQRVQVSIDSLRKILEEVLDNAFKFSVDGTPVHLSGVAGDHTYRWSIKDHGRGMTPEQIAVIGAGMQFERRLYEQQGSGLGLAISRQLVDLHAGTLVIDSEPGIHTTVHVALLLDS